MKKNPSSNKKNSKSLLSTTIEQIKRDLKGEYNEYQESPIENNNTNLKQKKINKKKYNNFRIESEKTNNEERENKNNNKNFNKKMININTTGSINNEKNKSKDNCINYYQLSSENNNNIKKWSNESILQSQIKDLKIKVKT
jgi:hypothetical protein